MAQRFLSAPSHGELLKKQACSWRGPPMDIPSNWIPIGKAPALSAAGLPLGNAK